MSIKHQKITVYSPQVDGSTKIEANSYYEKLAHSLVEISKQLPTSKLTVLRDVIDCLEHITRDKSIEVNIKIKAINGEPTQIIKRWIVSKEYYDRK